MWSRSISRYRGCPGRRCALGVDGVFFPQLDSAHVVGVLSGSFVGNTADYLANDQDSEMELRRLGSGEDI